MLRTIGGVLPGLLERIADVRLRGRTPFVVFDLDDTLFTRRNRHLRLLREFAADPGRAPAQLAAVQYLIACDEEGRHGSIAQAAHAAGADLDALRRAMHDFWMERFHQDEYMLEDAPVPGASEYIRALLCLRGVIVYLTHRSESQREGTVSALERSGFPLPGAMPWRDRVRLAMRQDPEEADLDFKLAAMDSLARQGELLACFENDAGYLDAMMDRFPTLLPVLLHLHHDSRHAGRHPAIVRIEDFLPRAS